ncbi:MAG: DUF5618 family protein [Bacteroidales bacterium]|jgi:uncharacterized protein YnzC (UPF0291/DUF896 family)|nr:DUF5618 family protein [Bacteroidales bacterium]
MSTVDKSRESLRKKSNIDVFSNKVSNILDDLTLSQKERQQALRKVYYEEAVRYRENAKKYLENTKVNNNGYYEDKKYIRTACGVAYSGLLIALDCYLILKGVEVIERTKKDIHFYRANLNKQNRKLGDNLDNAYDILHRWGYYDGIGDSVIVKRGFKELDMFIELINPNKS